MIGFLAALAAVLGPFASTIVVAIPALILAAMWIARRDSVRAQVTSEVRARRR